MLLLRTFGSLELLDAHGVAVASQRKPLLILALAALTPGGVPRDRLLEALWPQADRVKARATLKQHLYALRRATGRTDLVGGSPRLRIASATLRVDAMEFADAVEQGRIAEAAEWLRGELLEGVIEGHEGTALETLVAEIRAAWAGKIALARAAHEARRHAELDVVRVVDPEVLAAERELVAAARRFTHGLAALPVDTVAAHHRATWCSHDLLEAIRAAELAGLSAARIADRIAEPCALWYRSDLVREWRQRTPGARGDVAVTEWLLDGAVRTVDPIGRALEGHLLDSAVAARLRQRVQWQAAQLGRTLAASTGAPRVLLLGAGGAREALAALPLLRHLGATVVVSDTDAEALGLAGDRLRALGDHVVPLHGDPFGLIPDFARHGLFDLILGGDLYDTIATRDARWLTSTLLTLLAPPGRLCLANAAPGQADGAWLRHIVGRPVEARDREAMLLLLGEAVSDCIVTWHRQPIDQAWFLTVHRRDAHRGRAA